MDRTQPSTPSSSWKLALAALGIVFGDIGTSPLYALRACLGDGVPSIPKVLGTLSLVFWALLLVVSVKYISIVMRTDNKGEGGILALTALALKLQKRKGIQGTTWVMIMGILGAALLYSNGILTPAVSVLAAVEGLGEITTAFHPYVLPISLVVLMGLFLLQSRGSGKVGVFFGPIIFIWFLTLGLLGLLPILRHPDVLWALNPYWALRALLDHGFQSVVILGAVFLTMTGAEVLYADLGHFGRKPIVRAWYVLVFPCLLLNYFGQGALILANPGQEVGNLFFRMAPSWALVPLVLLATAATVIASQAVFTGTFSLARQAVQLGFFPRIAIRHTSADTVGQVYVPLMNWLLLLGIVGLVFIFQESGKLAAAYGIAVALTMLVTSVLMIYIFLIRKKWRPALVLICAAPFVLLDLVFVMANIPKILTGGWIVLVVGTVVFVLMHTWIRGRSEMGRMIAAGAMSLDTFVRSLSQDSLRRVDGVAVFLSDSSKAVPRTLLHNLKHNKVLHEKVVILNVITQDVPHVRDQDRYTFESLGNGIYTMSIYFGFTESPNVPAVLILADIADVVFHPMKTTYFLGRDSIVIEPHRKNMPLWMKHVYVFLSHNALNATKYFSLPPNRVVELGGQHEF
jgi:KUP system potassium uptake protein